MLLCIFLYLNHRRMRDGCKAAHKTRALSPKPEDPEKPLSLLVEDLSDSHDQITWPIISGLSDCEQSVAALVTSARLFRYESIGYQMHGKPHLPALLLLREYRY